MTYFLMKLVSKCVEFMPNALRGRFGDMIGAATWLLVPDKRKRMATRNIAAALAVDDEAAAKIARLSWTRFGRMLTEVMALPKLKKDIGRYVRVEGEINLKRALAHGNGAILATAHSGNWELLGAALALHGYPIVAVAQKQANDAMDRLINEYRTLAGMHVTYKNGVREMIRLLGKGHIIGMLMDQDAGRDGIAVEFFGREASCAQGPAFLARLKHAPVVPMFITDHGDGTHTLFIQKAIWVEDTEDKEADIRHATVRLTRLIEAHIRAYPTEWFWLHNRWKSRASQEASAQGER